MKRLIGLIVTFGILGLAAGYAIFGRDPSGVFINPLDLFLPQGSDLGGLLKSIGTAVRSGFRVDDIRRAILISGAVGAGAGLLVAVTTAGKRR